jgi:hypothetical protein
VALEALILCASGLGIRKLSVDFPYVEDQQRLSVYLTHKSLKTLILRTIAGKTRNSPLYFTPIVIKTRVPGVGMEARPRKLLDQVRDVIRLKHYSYRTEETDLH